MFSQESINPSQVQRPADSDTTPPCRRHIEDAGKTVGLNYLLHTAQLSRADNFEQLD